MKTLKKYSVFLLPLAVIFGMFWLTADAATVDVSENFSVTYTVVSSARVGTTFFDYEVRANAKNNGNDAKNVSAVLAEWPSSATVIKGDLNFGDIAAGSTATSTDTFTIRLDRLTPFDGTKLLFAFTAEFKEPGSDFIETAGVYWAPEFKMVYVEGGTFTLGWEGHDTYTGELPHSTTAVRNVSVGDYYIGETEVTSDLWNAVMGRSYLAANGGNRPMVNVNWYDIQEFCARLYAITGKRYRLATEAEWEFAAKGGNPGYAAGHNRLLFSGSDIESEVAVMGGVKPVKSLAPNILGIYDMSGNVDEWVWNAWSGTHTSGTNPTGSTVIHQQRTRRGGPSDGESYFRFAVARQIRSIDGADGSLGFRLAVSADFNSLPPGMADPMSLHEPVLDDRDTPNSYRDPRWITGDEYEWSGSFQNYGAGRLKIWEDGTAVMRPNSGTAINGQWYTVNNYALVIIPTSGTTRIYPYLFNTLENLSLINSAGFLQAPYGYFTKQLATTPAIAKPVINNLVATEDLAPGNGVLATAGTTDHRLWDMDNIPLEARSQDSRLVDSLTTGWWLGLNAGGEHTYRKDVDADDPDDPGSGQFRFHVYIPGQWNNTLARGSWFTVNNMFLRVYDPNSGAKADYMYIVTGTGTNRAFMHLSFQDYERGDNRYFTIYNNSQITGQTEELPTGPPMFMGQSTFRADRSKPKPCPGLPGLGPDGNDIRECDDITIDYDEGVHVYYSSKTDPQTELIRAWLPAQNAVVALKPSNDLTMYDFMDAVRPAIDGKPFSMDLLAFEMVEATQSSNGLITGVIQLSYGSYTQDVIINRVIPRLPRASGGQTAVAWNITTDATVNEEPFVVTVTGLVDGWSLFDLSVIGASGINNALWFEDCGTVSFNQDVTLSYQGSSTRAVAAGEVIVIDASMSEWAVSLDGGNFLTFIAQNSCGNFCGLPPELDLADFPGTLEPIYAPTTWLITPNAPVNGMPFVVMANGLVDGWSQFDLSLIFGGGPGPFTYAIWFEDGGTVSFNQDVTLSYQGASFREVAAGELLEIDASTSEWAVSLDDGNSLILIAQNSCGNFCGLPPELDFADFPGIVETLVPTTTWIVEPQASYSGTQLIITATGLIEDWLEFDLGALIGSGSGVLFNHVLFFEEGAALTFNQDVDLRYQGTVMRTVLVGDVFYLTEDTIEYGVTLDDGNTVVFVLESDAGYYGSIGVEPDLPLSEFPGTAYIENGADACIVN